MAETNLFQTSDLDLGAYLMLKGLPFIGCKIESEGQKKPRAVMRFVDEKQKARDLERLFMTSEEKKISRRTQISLKRSTSNSKSVYQYPFVIGA